MTNYLLLFLLYALLENDETFFIHIVFFQIVMVNRKVKYNGTYIDLLSKKNTRQSHKNDPKEKKIEVVMFILKVLKRGYQETIR